MTVRYIHEKEISERIEEIKLLGEEAFEDEGKEAAELAEFLAKHSEEAKRGLIHENDIQEYMQDYLEDVHGVDFSDFPFSHIDWDAAEKVFLQDYESLYMDGSMWFYRKG